MGLVLKSFNKAPRFFKVNEEYFFFLNNNKDLNTPSISKTSFLYFLVTAFFISLPTLKASPNSV